MTLGQKQTRGLFSNEAELGRQESRFQFAEAPSFVSGSRHSFRGPNGTDVDDPDHSGGERRLLTFGVTRTGRYLIVCHVERGNVTRVISARETNRREKIIYEEG